MCGIAGWYRRSGRPVSAGAVRAQCAAIVHRGPDDDGVYIDGDFGFGMQRLSILDLAGGHQPMHSEDERLAIVFNGEIFNHRALREELRGYRFRTHSDTETILAAYARWGTGAWAKLEGMFTVAIWDRAERRLTLARDPLGIKPLYVSEQLGGLSFASELKALRVLPDHAFDIDERAVHDYFSFGHVRRPRSIFRQVRTLEPGHWLTLGSQGPATGGAYWAPRLRSSPVRSAAAWYDEMRTMLRDTTARHMQSDVPVGAFLSGGIDSSAVLAAMRASTDQPLTAFTVGYPGAAIDESEAAATIARHLGCRHEILALDMGEAKAALPEVLRCFDEPFADMAAIPTWFASKAAAEHVKVVLCGEGGDELFAGYKRHRNARLIERYRPLLAALSPLRAAIRRIPPTRSRKFNMLRQHMNRFSEFVDLPDGYQQFFAATQISQISLRASLYDPGLWERQENEDNFARLEQEYFPRTLGDTPSALEQFLLADLTVNMPSAMLTRLDRASMAHSLEARVPFLSHKLVDWALTVPPELKLRGTTGKRILRKAVAPWLPADILRRPKQGFQIPYAAWLRGDFGHYAEEVWKDSGAAALGYLDDRFVTRLFAEHRKSEANHGRILYAIAAFGMWWNQSSGSSRGNMAMRGMNAV